MTLLETAFLVLMLVLVLGAGGIHLVNRRADRRLGEDAKRMLREMNEEDK